ncbi:hypothetical protein IU486_26725 [Streptomyces gardneri]|uniref:hypothetical protein n=1 Tax=Nocardia sputi TaxID=2943705 RepID=UPI0018930A66|nr:hypothetical protein [Nocardia sputi]MBF6168318.1 hypothetical protein [Streptomyces gardneri]MBF6205812.1 hypothetical protein [Streptomyces gardneri]
MPQVHASTPDPRDPATIDIDRAIELAVEIERHRYLLHRAVEDYRLRVRRRFEHLDPPELELRLRQAEQFIEALMIDPIRHGALDLVAYRAIRDGAPVVFDAERRTYVLRRHGQAPLPIRPGLPEHRLGVIARLAGIGLRLEEIQVVALTTAQTVAPHEAAERPEEVPEVQRGTTKPSRGIRRPHRRKRPAGR